MHSLAPVEGPIVEDLEEVSELSEVLLPHGRPIRCFKLLLSLLTELIVALHLDHQWRQFEVEYKYVFLLVDHLDHLRVGVDWVVFKVNLDQEGQ